MNKKTVWIVVIVVVLLIIGGIVFYLINRSRPEAETTTPSRTTTQPSPTPKGRALPSSDVMGTDLESVSRYPGSVRVSYSKSSDSGVIKISYQTKDLMEEVQEYYYDKMISLGWQMTSSEGPQVVFEKEPARLYLWLEYSRSNQTTTYELKYFP